MMDASALAPRGFHPAKPSRNLSHTKDAKFLRRTAVAPVKYYFIDFDLSSMFDDPSQPRLVKGIYGQNKHVPEMSEIISYDPFALDVFVLGDALYTAFTWVSLCI